jgi:hypothetical protein
LVLFGFVFVWFCFEFCVFFFPRDSTSFKLPTHTHREHIDALNAQVEELSAGDQPLIQAIQELERKVAEGDVERAGLHRQIASQQKLARDDLSQLRRTVEELLQKNKESTALHRDQLGAVRAAHAKEVSQLKREASVLRTLLDEKVAIAGHDLTRDARARDEEERGLYMPVGRVADPRAEQDGHPRMTAAGPRGILTAPKDRAALDAAHRRITADLASLEPLDDAGGEGVEDAAGRTQPSQTQRQGSGENGKEKKRQQLQQQQHRISRESSSVTVDGEGVTGLLGDAQSDPHSHSHSHPHSRPHSPSPPGSADLGGPVPTAHLASLLDKLRTVLLPSLPPGTLHSLLPLGDVLRGLIEFAARGGTESRQRLHALGAWPLALRLASIAAALPLATHADWLVLRNALRIVLMLSPVQVAAVEAEGGGIVDGVEVGFVSSALFFCFLFFAGLRV